MGQGDRMTWIDAEWFLLMMGIMHSNAKADMIQNYPHPHTPYSKIDICLGYLTI
jgi:hypothetical protein